MAGSQSLALAVTGPGDSPAPAESPRLDSFQFSSFQVRSLSLSSLARPAASHAGGPAVEEPGRPFKLPGPVGAAEPSARRTRSSGSSLSSLSRTQASVPSQRARRSRRARWARRASELHCILTVPVPVNRGTARAPLCAELESLLLDSRPMISFIPPVWDHLRNWALHAGPPRGDVPAPGARRRPSPGEL